MTALRRVVTTVKRTSRIVTCVRRSSLVRVEDRDEDRLFRERGSRSRDFANHRAPRCKPAQRNPVDRSRVVMDRGRPEAEVEGRSGRIAPGWCLV